MIEAEWLYDLALGMNGTEKSSKRGRGIKPTLEERAELKEAIREHQKLQIPWSASCQYLKIDKGFYYKLSREISEDVRREELNNQNHLLRRFYDRMNHRIAKLDRVLAENPKDTNTPYKAAIMDLMLFRALQSAGFIPREDKPMQVNENENVSQFDFALKRVNDANAKRVFFTSSKDRPSSD